jgi:hypothetical protein
LEKTLAAVEGVDERGSRFPLTVGCRAWDVSKDLRGPCTGNSFGFAFKSATFRLGVSVFVIVAENGAECLSSSVVVEDIGDV